jgi:hypothetical protein
MNNMTLSTSQYTIIPNTERGTITHSTNIRKKSDNRPIPQSNNMTISTSQYTIILNNKPRLSAITTAFHFLASIHSFSSPHINHTVNQQSNPKGMKPYTPLLKSLSTAHITSPKKRPHIKNKKSEAELHLFE